MKNQKEINWYKLDNTAKVFPIVSDKNLSNVFRVAVVLKEDIDPVILKSALEEVLPLFPVFKVRIKSGLFWYYYEVNNKEPIVEKEQNYPCAYIDVKTNNRYHFKVTYYKKRINLDLFHSITDGMGAINFLKNLTFAYIRLSSNQKTKTNFVEMNVNNELPDLEDSYIKNYEKNSLKDLEVRNAFQMKGKMMPVSVVRIIHSYMNSKKLYKIAKRKKATVTEYITALLMFAMYSVYYKDSGSTKPMIIEIPVNLRKFFSSNTATNFFGLMPIVFQPNRVYTFDEVLSEVSRQFEEKATKEAMTEQISRNVSFEKNFLVRIIPLFLKKVIIKVIYFFSKRGSSSIVSNLGIIDVPREYQKYIERFQFVLEVTKELPVKIGVITYNNELELTFTSKLYECKIEKFILDFLKDRGLKITIESNGERNE